MQDLDNNNNAQEQVNKEVNTTQKTEKEQQAEKFLKSLEKEQKQVKSKTISFKCTLEDYTMLRAKAILKNVSIADYIINLSQKDKVKEYTKAKESFKNLFS
jgi:predicted metal-dependent hydrolase